jgi:DNA excision repair protein ERCC-4
LPITPGGQPTAQGRRFSGAKSGPLPLTSGDYSATGLETLFAIERKSIADLVNRCINANRDRFERELHRLRGFRFKRLLIVGTEEEIWRCKYHSNISPKAVLATLSAFEIRSTGGFAGP